MTKKILQSMMMTNINMEDPFKQKKGGETNESSKIETKTKIIVMSLYRSILKEKINSKNLKCPKELKHLSSINSHNVSRVGKR